MGSKNEVHEMSSNTGSRIGALHRATLSLFSDLSMDGVLRRIIEAARELSQARYAALGISDGKGGLETFITLGLTDEEVDRIPHLPVGDGLIGEMMHTGKSIRVPEIADHPKSVGFPSGHPRMHSFLGVPISAYGRPLGQIYLTDKQGADSFSDDDQRLIEMLAAQAAAAIENARLYRKISESENELSQRNLELELVNSLATAASSTTELNVLLEMMLERLINLFGAGAGEFFLRDEDEGFYYKVFHHGDSVEVFWDVDVFHPGEGLIGRAAKMRMPQYSHPLSDGNQYLNPSVTEAGFNSMVCVPLTAPGQVVGVFCLAFKGEREIHAREMGLLEAVGAGVGVLVENARLYRQIRRLAVLEERERIGMDLHDGIIQSIYAVGLILEYIRILVKEDPQQAEERLEHAIDGLNVTISDLRSYILDLQPSRIQIDDFNRALERLTREFKRNTLLDVELMTEPDALMQLELPVITELFHIAQEALANVAKHAGASRVWLSLRQVEGDVLLQVIDNGKGFDTKKESAVLGHGLSNMVERARKMGGQLNIVSDPGDGTTITVHLPVDEISQETPSSPDVPSASLVAEKD
jgi:signal transduction histidine kinase